VHAALNFRSVSRFKGQLQGFDQVHACSIDRRALAGDVHLRTQGHIAVALPLDDRRQLPSLHGEEAYHATAPSTTFPSSIHLVAPTVPCRHLVDEGLITTAKLRMPAYCDSTLTTAYASTNEVGCTVSGNTQSP